MKRMAGILIGGERRLINSMNFPLAGGDRQRKDEYKKELIVDKLFDSHRRFSLPAPWAYIRPAVNNLSAKEAILS